MPRRRACPPYDPVMRLDGANRGQRNKNKSKKTKTTVQRAIAVRRLKKGCEFGVLGKTLTPGSEELVQVSYGCCVCRGIPKGLAYVASTVCGR